MKKFISVMLVAAMAVTALTGCGSNSGSSSKKDADKYYIGGIGPTTGATAIYGTAVKNGAQIAVDEINAAGGINGKQIEYRFEDDQNDAEKAVNAYNTLKDWGMQMLVGTTTTAPTRTGCAPLWYFPLLSLSLTMGRLRPTRLRLSPAQVANPG